MPDLREMHCPWPRSHPPHEWDGLDSAAPVTCPGVGGPPQPVHLRGDTDETACRIHLADGGLALALAASIRDVTCPACRARVEVVES